VKIRVRFATRKTSEVFKISEIFGAGGDPMVPSPVFPTSWVDVLGKMERAVEHWLPAIRETSPESFGLSIPPARPLPMPNLNGLDAATPSAEGPAGEADAVLQKAADDLQRWLAECQAVGQKLAVRLERAVG
jgi:hypothetical protein